MLKPDDLGSPALKIVGLQLWVHGRECPDATDYWDGNWLRATVHCSASGASIWVQGAILMVQNIVSFLNQCQQMLDGQLKQVSLEPYEPYLHLNIEPTDALGHLRLRVEITPDHMMQKHTMDFEIDQTFLPEIIRQCRCIINEYPVRKGKNDKAV